MRRNRRIIDIISASALALLILVSALSARSADESETKEAQPSIKELARIRGFSEWTTSVAFSRDGKLLAVGSYESVKVYDAKTFKQQTELTGVSGFVRSLAFSPDDKLLAASCYQSVLLWNTETNKQAMELKGHRGYVSGASFSADGKWLATSSEDETVRLWNIAKGGEQGPVIKGHTFPVMAVAFSPDGKFLATASGDETRVTIPGEVRLWSVETGTEVRSFPKHKKAATGVAFSLDGKHLVSTSVDETVNVYTVETGEAVGFFGGHSRPTTSVLFGPDGKTVISASGGRAKGKNEVKLWDLLTGEERASIEGHKGKVTSIALSSDGKKLATASYDQTVAVWNVSALFSTAETTVAANDDTSKKTAVKKLILKDGDLRAGIIGLDTSHVLHFTRMLNEDDAAADLAHCRVVAAYPKGSPDIETSVSRVPKYTAQVKEMGVEIVDSIDALIEKVDVVLLETNDGRPHLEQIIPVLKAGKPVFIDKPIAGSLTDAVAIFEMAKKHKVPVFSSSSLRFGKNSQSVRNGSIGKVTNCVTQSPASLEKTHPDLFWYGIHGVESLFTVMGTGCQTVKRGKTKDGKIEVVGTWKGGRTGTFREGKGYSGTAKGEKGETAVGSYDGYRPLLVEIVKFFRTGKVPVSEAETLEIYAFMEAADESKRRNGESVELDAVMAKARKEAAMRTEKLE